MSYILDALRRAQAERGRGSVPDLHTPATPVTGLPVARAGAVSYPLAGTNGEVMATTATAIGNSTRCDRDGAQRPKAQTA